jgi:hypothetical protein
MYLTPDYKEIIELFNKYNVRYLLAGAYAMATFGYTRRTYEIDLWIDKKEKNVVKILKALEEFGIPFEITKDDLSKDNSVIQIGVAPVRIDILTDIDGVAFEDAFNNKKVVDFDGLEVFVLSIDDLLKNKKASNRAKDKIDVIELEAIKKGVKE